MSFLELLVLSTALGADLFSASIPIGMNRVRLKVILRASIVFALFHIVMILTGYHVGHWLDNMVEHVGTYHIEYPALMVQNWASAFGALVLAGLGLCMIKENLAPGNNENGSCHPLQGSALFMLAFSVSVDALAAGFSMGMMEVDLLKLSVILGTVIFVIAVCGLGLGRKAGRYLGTWAELAGGLALILLSIHVLWTALC
ncbi:putative manganese efflux pump [Lucifera butyrica]|uniref:Putative manganese efflux pump n=1 Tax=Lucifera butyrica TaxID=1351585 RepID=A0A498R580_9FIRM|nr:manganese efflux pump [Lucifera butyrica]VBB06541.1 putative manganese efflux pump [Lucifera butyrica]